MSMGLVICGQIWLYHLHGLFLVLHLMSTPHYVMSIFKDPKPNQNMYMFKTNKLKNTNHTESYVKVAFIKSIDFVERTLCI